MSSDQTAHAEACKPWSEHGRWAKPWLLALILVAVQALPLFPALNHAFVMDDAVYITENPAVTQGAPLGAYFLDRATVASDKELQWQSYRPLRTLGFHAIVRLFGVRAAAFRLANLVLWGICLHLLLRQLQRLKVTPGLSFVAVLLVALAPVHVEPLVYPSAFGDLLSLALQLAAIDLLLGTWAHNPGRIRWVLLTIGAGLVSMAALLTKESAVVTPFLLGLFAFNIWKQAELKKPRVLIDLGIQFGSVVIFLAARTLVLRAVGHSPTTAHSVAQALFRLPWVLLNYAYICVVPLGHIPAYTLPSPSPIVLVVPWTLLIFVSVILFLKPFPFIRFGAAWFGISLLPVLGLIPLAADMADRYALLASLGLVFLVVGVAQAVSARALSWARLGVAALALVYLPAAWVEQGAWASDKTLWEKSVALEPRSAQAFRNLGLIRLKQGSNQEAVRLLDRALALGSPPHRVNYYRAMALEADGRLHEAQAAARLEVQLNPAFGRAHALLGGIDLSLGLKEKARQALRVAQELEPLHPSTYLLELQLAVSDGDKAKEQIVSERLLRQNPSHPRFLYLRALALMTARPAVSAVLMRRCLELDAQHPYCLSLLGRIEAQQTRHQKTACARLDVATRHLPEGEERRAAMQVLQNCP